MSGKLILITGATGAIGFQVLRTALRCGHHVRAVVRSKSGLDKIKTAIPASSFEVKIEFVLIEDLAAPGAFDSVMKGVEYIIHLASPRGYQTNDFVRDYWRPAIDITLNVFSAAAKNPGVKRIVVTSSLAALIPAHEFVGGVLKRDVVTADDECTVYDMNDPLFGPGTQMLAYAAAKTMALLAAEDFIASKKPQFDALYILPSMVLGENPLAISAEDFVSGGATATSGYLMKLILGQPAGVIPGSSVSVHDVADLHVKAIDSSIPSGRYLLAGDVGTNWEDAIGIIEKWFPENIGKPFADKGDCYTFPIKVDASKTKKAFGITFRDFDEQVKDTVVCYLSLLEKTGS